MIPLDLYTSSPPSPLQHIRYGAHRLRVILPRPNWTGNSMVNFTGLAIYTVGRYEQIDSTSSKRH